jgi:hypothetical protein
MPHITGTGPSDDQSELLEEQSEFLQALTEYARVQTNLLTEIRRYLQFMYVVAGIAIGVGLAAAILAAVASAQS